MGTKMNADLEFDEFFKAATGCYRYDYQRGLAEIQPDSLLIEVPTGMGKTAAVVLAWLWNRAGHPDAEHRDRWPRRLVYCLPMRTLVEQTRRNVTDWLSKLAAEYSTAELQWLAANSPVILMGGEEGDPDKAEWDLYPEKPCIIIGTQDMLLSRALNRGYAMSRYRWPMHFGLLNNDCLWVMDEVQLMGPGLWTSGQLDWMRLERFKSPQPLGCVDGCVTWWMSATNSGGFLDTRDRRQVSPAQRFSFDPNEMPCELRDARRPCEFWTPPRAATRGRRRGNEAQPVVSSEDQFLAELAAAVVGEHVPGTLTLVVCNRVATAQGLNARIGSLDRTGADLILLTSRFRKEDRQANERRLIEFEDKRRTGTPNEGRVLICVATQVVEAGVDVSACRLWTEVAPWPSLVQRLGRLNRDGKSNADARAFFFELPSKTAKGRGGATSGQYPPEAVAVGRSLAQELIRVCSDGRGLSQLAAFDELRRNQKVREKMNEALRPSPEPFPRAMDVHGLFSTEPDLFGGFTDVSCFVRGKDPQSDVTVFWREFEAAKPVPKGDALDGPAYDEREGCAVSIGRFREFLGKDPGFVWDDRKSAWQRHRGDEICPGMVVMLPRRAGGYNSSQGWTGRPGDRVAAAPRPGPFDEDLRADPSAEHGEWVTLSDHLADVRREAEQIAGNLGLKGVLRESVVTAAANHDIGKALERWQNELPQPRPSGGDQWAKAPYLFAVCPGAAGFDVAPVESVLPATGMSFRRVSSTPGSRLANCCLWHTSARVRDTRERSWLSDIRGVSGVKSAWMVQFRPGLRHEAASAMALWHQYYHGRAKFPGLTIYLTAAHHGKVRTVLTGRRGDDVCGVSRDTAVIPWDGGLPLDFSCAADGAHGKFCEDGSAFEYESPGWTALIADVLGGWEGRPEKPTLLALRDASEPSYLGPFTLAYLETLVRCADMRASQHPSRHYDV